MQYVELALNGLEDAERLANKGSSLEEALGIYFLLQKLLEKAGKHCFLLVKWLPDQRLRRTGGRASQMRRVVHQDSIVSHISRPSNQHRHYAPSQFVVDAKDTPGNRDVLRQKMSLRCECNVAMTFHN